MSMTQFQKCGVFRNAALLRLAKGRQCLVRSPICCGRDDTVVACHSNSLRHGKGRGLKAGDQWTVWGCVECNRYLDQYAGASKDEKQSLFDEAHARQIDAWRKICLDMLARPRDREAASWALQTLGLSAQS